MIKKSANFKINLLNTVKEFLKMEKGQVIERPLEEVNIYVKIPLKNIEKKTVVNRKVLKHTAERLGADSIPLVCAIVDVLERPTKIVDNSAKRANSFLLARINGKPKGVVLEIIKKDEKNTIASMHYIRRGFYDKMKDISGRAAVPPSETF